MREPAERRYQLKKLSFATTSNCDGNVIFQSTYVQTAYQATVPNNDFEQTEPDKYFPQAVRNRTLEAIVCNIFPVHAFHYSDNREGIMQSFVVVDELAKSLGAAIYRYKITSWNVLVENLNVTKNKTYYFSKYNFAPEAN